MGCIEGVSVPCVPLTVAHRDEVMHFVLEVFQAVTGFTETLPFGLEVVVEPVEEVVRRRAS